MRSNRPLETLHRRGQQGSTLIVALVMLLLVSLIAVSGMQDTILQERMASNAEGRSMSFDAAEVALREGEGAVDPAAGGGGNDGGSDRMDDPLGDWSGFTTMSILASDDRVDDRVAESPEYHLSPAECAKTAEGGCDVEIFDVTARGFGGNNNTVTILRTNFGRLN